MEICVTTIRWIAWAVLAAGWMNPARAQTADMDRLPDAPDAASLAPSAAVAPELFSSSLAPAAHSAQGPEVTLRDCPYDKTHARICHVHWGQLVISSVVF